MVPTIAGGPAGVAVRERRRTIAIVAEWWSIEVLHDEVSAFRWQEQHDSALIEAALTNGVRDGAWHADRWGVVFEVLFASTPAATDIRPAKAGRDSGRRVHDGRPSRDDADARPSCPTGRSVKEVICGDRLVCR
jgi:hypothetical protein